MIISFLFILACFLGDVVLSVLFPASFLPSDIVFVHGLGLSALVLSKRQMDPIDSHLLFLLFGLLYDFYASDTIFFYMIIFGILSFLVAQWQKHMMDSVFESALLCITTIFVKEVLIYFVMYLTHHTSMTFQELLVNRIFVTILVNGIFILLIILASRMINDMILMREKRIRKEERVTWWKLKLKP